MKKIYAIFAGRAIEWLERLGALALTVYHTGRPATCTQCSTTEILIQHGSFSTPFFVFSTRWKEFQFTSLHQAVPKPLIRIASLTASDVPMLQSMSICLPHFPFKPCV